MPDCTSNLGGTSGSRTHPGRVTADRAAATLWPRILVRLEGVEPSSFGYQPNALTVELQAGAGYFCAAGSSTTSEIREGIRRRSTRPDHVVPGGITTLVGPNGVETFTTNGIGVSFRIVASIAFSAGTAHPERAKMAARNVFIRQKYNPNIGRGDRCRTGVSSLAKRRTTVVLHPENSGCQGRNRTCDLLFQRQPSVPSQSAWHWWERWDSNPHPRRLAALQAVEHIVPDLLSAPENFGGSGELCSRYLLLARQALS
jgi:hypothetical protein